ncbi:MAG TPA: DUF2207 domain-containing protein [Dehalococcoidia bacterium]|nr:DUF2207 domain-containing protein [Dehalococcoidia bacterium]
MRFSSFIRWSALAILALVAVALAPARSADAAATVIRSFDARYELRTDGSFKVTEDILIDFADNQMHGITRDIQVEYAYDDTYNRLVDISGVSVSSGSQSVPVLTSRNGSFLNLRIGDANRLVSGQQRYVVSYLVRGGMNAFDDHDELYWNITGNQSEYLIEKASATVVLPGGSVTQIACYEGPTGSTAPCNSTIAANGAQFAATTALNLGSGLTVVVGVPKGLITVPPPQLVLAQKSVGEVLDEFLGLNPAVYAGTAVLGVFAVFWLGRLWWQTGRDRWLGDNYYLNPGKPDEQIKPPFSHETVLPELEPPKLPDQRRADGAWDRLTPAEVGVLLDERADTLDVSATVVDLAVRQYLRIEDVTPDDGGETDYKLTKLKEDDSALHPFESVLLKAIFDGGDEVMLSSLRSKGSLHDSLLESKDGLYEDSVKARKLFPSDPNSTRVLWVVKALFLVGAGAGVGMLIGVVFGVGLLALPIILAGIALVFMANSMPRRTGLGREMLRRSLGFRLFLVTAEEDREKFNEQQGIFSEFLPYAIVFHCVEKWANAFESASLAELDWYRSSSGNVFQPLLFAATMNSFSSSIGSTMNSLGVVASGSGWSSGGSGFGGSSGGFGGGGFSGGGGGGGGTGSW